MQRVLNWAMPDFLGIGAQRAGTTWLWQHLRSHPQIWTPRTKELHFFDRAWSRRWEHSARALMARYARHFVAGRLQGKVTGEVTPAYAILPDERVRMIASWMPRLKVVYLLRDPVERAWSQAAKSYERWAGHPLHQANEQSLRAFFQLPEVRERGDYVRALRTWRRHLPATQIFMCVSEQLFSSPAAGLRQIYAFLGVDAGVRLDESALQRRVHEGTFAPMPDSIRRHLQAALYSQRPELEELLGARLPWGQ